MTETTDGPETWWCVTPYTNCPEYLDERTVQVVRFTDKTLWCQETGWRGDTWTRRFSRTGTCAYFQTRADALREMVQRKRRELESHKTATQRANSELHQFEKALRIEESADD